MATKNRQQISITVDPHILKRIDRVAKQRDIPRSQVIDRLLRDSIAQAETEAKLLGDPLVMQAFSKAMSAPGVMSAMAAAMGGELTDKQQLQLRELLEGLGDIERGSK